MIIFFRQLTSIFETKIRHNVPTKIRKKSMIIFCFCLNECNGVALVGKTKRLIIEENMIVTFKKPIEGIRGKIRLEDGFYIRKLHGKYVVQRCPNRKGHVATERERENQQRFVQQYRRVQSTSLEDGAKAPIV